MIFKNSFTIFNTGNKYKTFFHFHTSVCAKTYIFLASFTLSPPDSHPANNWPAGRKNYMQVQPDIHASGENISCQCAKRFLLKGKKTRKGCQNTDVSTASSNSLFVYINYNIRSYNFFSCGRMVVKSAIFTGSPDAMLFRAAIPTKQANAPSRIFAHCL